MTNYSSEPSYAVFNAGRWIARCPICARKGWNVATEIKPGQDFICPIDNPGVIATMPVAVEFTDREKAENFRHGVKALFRIKAVPDAATREEASASALRHKVIWPKQKAEIERLLRMRPAKAMNWEPGETLDMIRAENAEHAVEVP